MVWFGMSFLKPWNFEKILSDSYSLKNFWFFGSFGFPKFQYLSGMFSFRFGTYSFRSGMNSYLSGIHSFRCNFSHSESALWIIIIIIFQVWLMSLQHPPARSDLAVWIFSTMKVIRFHCMCNAQGWYSGIGVKKYKI